ncbi:MAG: phosphatidylserine decarboxylase [Candidatus Heimdallarchaeum endolithica]|uniref:Phosphatidylserine decarboxylase n=1 Tax=Candidatus Heimdallarchaeum endolithica TaxID=2876572 RepID=A0A9Y1FPT5_9ARCH|nr:MAG: phosphatidylserine decarboxylase [Candidatus Heimdallarchaeum endolithica]
MKVARSSEKIVCLCLILSSLSLIVLFFLIIFGYYWFTLIPLTIVVICLFLVWSFRDPERTVKLNEKQVLSPADGILSEVDKKEDELYFTIRMSPFDVHMNRAPISGIVESVEFQKGSHWPVYFPNYAKRNQRNTIKIVNKELDVIAYVVQVSGIFARRTIAYVKPGDVITQGQKIGTIRFGSITHLKIVGGKNFLTTISVSTSVRAGLTALAQLNDK